MNQIQFYRDQNLPFFELKICSTSSLSYKKHTHEEYSIGIVDQGRSSFCYENKVDEICPKSMVFIPPDLVHSCNPTDRNTWHYKMLYINKDWVEAFLLSRGGGALPDIVVKDISACRKLVMVGRMIASIISDSSPLEKEASIFAVLEECLTGDKRQSELNYTKEHPKIKAVREYLDSCFLEKVTLEKLEQASGLSKFSIIRLFKDAFAVPPHTYQTLLRVNYAKKELRRNRSISEVAYDAGFYDQSHFIKVFKNYTGTTPDKYQNYI